MSLSGSESPPVTLLRYSWISSRESGVPWASRRMAVRSGMARVDGGFAGCVFADEADHLLDVFDGSVRDDAVAEVEDVSGVAPGLVEDLADALAGQVGGGEERDGVEVALDGAGVVEGAPGAVEWGAPVEAEDVGAGLAHRGEQAGGVDSEVDHGHAQGLHV